MPLVVAVDVAGPDLRGWWKPGDLLLAPPEPGPAVRPLANSELVMIPDDIGSWRSLSESCKGTPSPQKISLDGQPVEVRVEPINGEPRIQVRAGDRVLAEADLGRPARPCLLIAGEADALPGPEIILGWRAGDPEHIGITVWHVPECVQ